MIKLYDAPTSGHAHKARLFLSILGLPHELIRVDLAAKEQKSEGYLSMNPFGQVPVLVDDDVSIRDSNAILVYLAEKYGGENWLPKTPIGRARVQEWLSIASNELMHGPVYARAVMLFGRDFDLGAAQHKAHELFVIMDHFLSDHRWLAGEGTTGATIADISFYPYVARAPEGKVMLDDYPNIRSWLSRIEVLEGFLPMPETKAD